MLPVALNVLATHNAANVIAGANMSKRSIVTAVFTMRIRQLFALSIILFAVACDTPDRVTRLEKQVQELQAKVSKDQAAMDYDLQEKCAKDAKAWFNENWERGEKGTTLLNETHHFNKAQNKCFIVVEYHYDQLPAPSWVNHISLWDVIENTQYATFAQNHFIDYKNSFNRDNVITCEFNGTKCKTLEEFSNLISTYTSN
jgi:quinol monooxygenase YgiN